MFSFIASFYFYVKNISEESKPAKRTGTFIGIFSTTFCFLTKARYGSRKSTVLFSIKGESVAS
jgi:hypothetical protein